MDLGKVTDFSESEETPADMSPPTCQDKVHTKVEIESSEQLIPKSQQHSPVPTLAEDNEVPQPQTCLKCAAEAESEQELLGKCEKSVQIGADIDDPSLSSNDVESCTTKTSNDTEGPSDVGGKVQLRPKRNAIAKKAKATIDISNHKKRKQWCKDYWGIWLSLASGLASTFGGIIVKQLKDFHPFSLATYRFQGILLPTLIMLLYYKFIRKEDVFKSIWPISDKDKLMKFGFTIVRAVIGCLGLYLYFYAIKLMPLADAKVILSCRPVFVIFVARVFLGEPCGIFPVATSAVAVVGVAIISRPPILTGSGSFDMDTLMGTVFATSSMLAATLSLVVLRYLRGVHVSIVTLAFGFWGTILSIACSATVERLDVPNTRNEWVLLVLLAVSAFFSQTALTLAMKYEHAGAVVIVGTCDTIMSFVLQYFLLGDKPDIYSIFGATLIVICVSLITLRKWINSLPKGNPVRKRLGFVLK